MKLINLTPHNVTIFDANDVTITLASQGIARVDTTEQELQPLGNIPLVSAPIMGPVTGLPEPAEGVGYIVSLMVLQHPDVAGRRDVFAPATGPKHHVVRDEQGRIAGVTRLVAAPQS
jgi:hypothetical protein